MTHLYTKIFQVNSCCPLYIHQCFAASFLHLIQQSWLIIFRISIFTIIIDSSVILSVISIYSQTKGLRHFRRHHLFVAEFSYEQWSNFHFLAEFSSEHWSYFGFPAESLYLRHWCWWWYLFALVNSWLLMQRLIHL